ncbi:cytochrome b [Polynucleobacter sphagniphilus]|jgi:cytochrome b561|uniref:cytochrome b n=1 Tax=Polynucleobacter sphagniphilus TaxID=1743169 RepID=UPI0024066D8B|nr:cytochrome b [Polynucleobacter sphagniphilus]MDF9788899.1 cytochrome b561 [Polynucleobacter sphagniphilus]MDH6249968.1 cytochrome b561 [Polynucleobacter sphagniphilus]MDH6300367.1 cytochrome b561 [Polynucleobacter sphagniphilus]MDH6421903.1 cytochrome b561 [Polynucleobacter sphagniphilus]MDH6525493.1 cytochrome b561 [Polynucleobacter sphagniphilus]
MSTVRYNPISVAFHWLMAAIIVVTWSIAIVVSDMPLSPARITGYSWHKWLGVTVFFLVILRLVWRATHPAPQLEIKMPVWQERAMQLTHFALYLLMMVIPLVGWLMSSAKGYTVNYFGLFELPDLLSKDKALGHQLKDLHEYLADILVALVCLHVLAALKHQFIDKDGLLSRMSFCSCSKKKD